MSEESEMSGSEYLRHLAAGRHQSVRQVAEWFDWDHLEDPARSTSASCGVLASDMLEILPDSAELTAGLRKLLEAKDSSEHTRDAPARRSPGLPGVDRLQALHLPARMAELPRLHARVGADHH